MSNRKPTVWLGPGQVPYYTASAFGGCLRALVAARMGYEPVYPSDRMLKIYDAGHRSEDLCLTEMEKAGWKLLGLSQAHAMLVVRLRDNKPVMIVGHIDEQAIEPDGYPDPETVILEVKSQGPSMWDAYERHGPKGALWDRYAWQLSVYMHYFQLPARWVRWRRPQVDDDGKPDIAEPVWEVGDKLTTPPYSLEEITARVQEIEDWAAKGDFPPCSIDKDWDCPFRYLHGDNEEDDVETISVPGLEAWAARYEAARRAEAEAAAAKDEARKRILEMLEGLGDLPASVRAQDGAALVVVSRSQRRYLDEQALAAVVGDLEPYRKLGKEVTRVSVRYQGELDGGELDGQ